MDLEVWWIKGCQINNNLLYIHSSPAYTAELNVIILSFQANTDLFEVFLLRTFLSFHMNVHVLCRKNAEIT